jgi:hypothetical protein
MVLAELGGAIKGALSKLNNATVIDEEGAPSRSLPPRTHSPRVCRAGWHAACAHSPAAADTLRRDMYSAG